MLIGTGGVWKIVLLFSFVFISRVSKAHYPGFQTFSDVAVSVGKLRLQEGYTGGSAILNGGVQYNVLGIYLGIGPALFVPDNKESRRELTNYIGAMGLQASCSVSP